MTRVFESAPKGIVRSFGTKSLLRHVGAGARAVQFLVNLNCWNFLPTQAKTVLEIWAVSYISQRILVVAKLPFDLVGTRAWDRFGTAFLGRVVSKSALSRKRLVHIRFWVEFPIVFDLIRHHASW